MEIECIADNIWKGITDAVVLVIALFFFSSGIVITKELISFLFGYTLSSDQSIVIFTIVSLLFFHRIIVRLIVKAFLFIVILAIFLFITKIFIVSLGYQIDSSIVSFVIFAEFVIACIFHGLLKSCVKNIKHDKYGNAKK